MQFTLKLKEKKDGQYLAFCDELGLSVIDSDSDTALAKLQQLIFEDSFDNFEEMNLEFNQSQLNIKAAINPPQYVVLKNDDKIKTFYLPKYTTIH